MTSEKLESWSTRVLRECRAQDSITPTFRHSILKNHNRPG
jgi:hypothetical protein